MSVRAFRRSLCSALAPLVFAVGLTQGCMLHRTASERLVDAAQKLNFAARFGQLDTAVEQTSSSARATFLERRKLWGDAIRVVDVNVSGLNLLDDEHAEVTVQYAWTRMDEGTLHSTAVKQYWENPKLGGWRLEREQQAGGDLGLFGERVVSHERESHGDVHFATKSLGVPRAQ
jgi:hypothetical protein